MFTTDLHVQCNCSCGQDIHVLYTHKNEVVMCKCQPRLISNPVHTHNYNMCTSVCLFLTYCLLHKHGGHAAALCWSCYYRKAPDI